jgi:dipeptidyl aminopeptidase/acylaminoacyl peptidase
VHSGAPPFHLAHGTADRFVPHEQTVQLRTALERHGVPVECSLIDGADHVWVGVDDVLTLLEAGLDFARRVTGVS